MREVKRFCDPSGLVMVDQPGSILEANAGDLPKQTDEPWIDLCSPWSSLFLDWIRSYKSHHANHDGIGQALADLRRRLDRRSEAARRASTKLRDETAGSSGGG
jgi:hypothetical protein